MPFLPPNQQRQRTEGKNTIMTCNSQSWPGGESRPTWFDWRVMSASYAAVHPVHHCCRCQWQVPDPTLIWDEAPQGSVVCQLYNLTHTHIPFNGSFSVTTQVSRYQKGKTNLDFTEARGSEWKWHQLGHMQVYISHQTDNHASTPPLKFFYRPDR